MSMSTLRSRRWLRHRDAMHLTSPEQEGGVLVPVPPSRPLESVLDVLRCPTCGACLHVDAGALRCPATHTFDISRHGVVSLLTGTRATSGDDADMARARDRFLATGKYHPIRRAVAHLAAERASPRSTVVDAGCGTGYFLAGVLDRLPTARGLGLDTSTRALREAARAHERAAAATWDVFRPLPLVDSVADVVLDVFAPRNPSEFHRVLRPAGRLIVVRPTSRHLLELRDQVPSMIAVDPAKEGRLERALAPFFVAGDTEVVEYAVSLTRAETVDLLGMTPSARHADQVFVSDCGLAPGHVTVSVLATAYRPRAGNFRGGQA